MKQNKFIIIAAFILTSIFQIYVPAGIIADREILLSEGKELKFKCAPVDPSDPFRGKYITLYFEENSFTTDSNDWKYDENVYVTFRINSEGFSEIESVAKEIPITSSEYLKLKSNGFSQENKKLSLYYPFDRYYINEIKAPKTEEIYNSSLIDTNNVTYALVSIKDGEGAIKDVFINDKSVEEIILEE
ncbi:MAG: GDYXXLXY domain-containing protein [Ignavibacteria bacterium]